MGDKESIIDFYRGKRVFLTGHTGFKGAWLCAVLLAAGADVTGYALPPRTPSLFALTGLGKDVRSVEGDVRDFASLRSAFAEARPEIVFHLAAQPIVREGYRSPVDTYSTNVMGTVHLLECVRQIEGVQSVLNVTTDKVYANRRWPWGYREDDLLDRADPYSNSKSCSELVTHSYRTSFWTDGEIAVSTARAGNVIGGGDFSVDRILPDCIRAVQAGEPVRLRNPASVRPYQHVLDPLSAYLLIACRQYGDSRFADCYNVGPDSTGCISTAELAERFCRAWGDKAALEYQPSNGPYEDAVLRLDCSKIRSVLGWRPQWDVERAVQETVSWTRAWLDGQSPRAVLEQQIHTFFAEQHKGNAERRWKWSS